MGLLGSLGIWVGGSTLSAGSAGNAVDETNLEAPYQGTPEALGLTTFLWRVKQQNESIEVQSLDWLIRDRQHRAARAIFEPELVTSLERFENRRENTIEQQVEQFQPVFDEKNLLYDAGLEALVPTGARFRLGYSMSRLNNNLAQTRFGLSLEQRPQYLSFAGLSVTQPLLKNGGLSTTKANIRLAARESDFAFQQYRRQLMLMIGQAEAAYWDLYFTQEQLELRQESARIAAEILKDNRERLTSGMASQLDVLEAQAGLALREARVQEAQQLLVDAMNQLTAMFSPQRGESVLAVKAVDAPELEAIEAGYQEGMEAAMAFNPDYLRQLEQLEQEDIRVAYAKNQRLPQLDLKMSYGLNGLGDSVGKSWDDIERSQFENFSVGLEFRVPLGGGRKSMHELEAARLRKEQALLNMKALETSISTGLDTSLWRVRSAYQQAANYDTIVSFNERLLQSELETLKIGKTDSRTVFEVEETLSQARSSALDNVIRYKKAIVQWELVKGTLLRRHAMEADRDRLRLRRE